MTRSPSVAIAYLCLFLKAKNWKDPDQVAEYIKNHHRVSNPNMLVVHKTIKANKHI